MLLIVRLFVLAVKVKIKATGMITKARTNNLSKQERLGMVARAYDFNPQAARVVDECQASRGYKARPCLKKEKYYKGTTKNNNQSSLQLRRRGREGAASLSPASILKRGEDALAEDSGTQSSHSSLQDAHGWVSTCLANYPMFLMTQAPKQSVSPKDSQHELVLFPLSFIFVCVFSRKVPYVCNL